MKQSSSEKIRDGVFGSVRTFLEGLSKKTIGRPLKWSLKEVFNGVWYILKEGCRWESLPRIFPPKSTCHRYFQMWSQEDIFLKAVEASIQELEDSGQLSLKKTFIDGTFARSKGGLESVGPTKCGKGHKIMIIVEESGIPISVGVENASTHESQLAVKTVEHCFTKELPEKLIGDKAYDSDKLDSELAEKGVEMIAPNRSNRKKKTQDKRKLRSYKHRWRVENCNNLLQRYRKVPIKYELYLKNYEGFVLLATLGIIFQHSVRKGFCWEI
jgi:transposase